MSAASALLSSIAARLRRPRSSTSISLLLAAYLLATGNLMFWSSTLHALQPVAGRQWLFLLLLAAMLLALLWLLCSLLLWPRSIRLLGGLLVLVTAAASYFTDRYGVLIDRVALQSLLESDPRELREWLDSRMLLQLAVAVPALWLVWWQPLRENGGWDEVRHRLLVLALAVGLLALGLASFYSEAAMLARNHRELHHLLNPLNGLAAGASLLQHRWRTPGNPLQPVGRDARLRAHADRLPRRLVLVVGESARASSFSLLGYPRETNPELATRNVVALEADSCGTATAVALPCMFLARGRAEYRDGDARRFENLLDVLRHAGLAPQWIDNNTGSKAIAARTGEQRIEAADYPAFCAPSGECRDEALLAALVLPGQLVADQFVVLHQKGSHGPSYFERYPPALRRFTPTCDSNQLQRCSREQIVNTYDNSILYTDQLLARLIDRLQADASHASALLYVSDHGESTGEHGVFLHGMPYPLAPAEQTRVPLLLWLSDAFRRDSGIGSACLAAQRGEPHSHDQLFHTVLGLLDVDTASYRRELDLLADCRVRP